MSDDQQQFELPKWASLLLTLIAVGFFGVIVLSVFLHLFDKDRFPSPESLSVEILAIISVLTILTIHFPWSKISFGGIEIQRVVQQQNKDHLAEIEKIKQKKSDDVVEYEIETVITGGETGNSPPKQNGRELVVKLLEQYPTWGFSLKRILNWGGKQAGYESIAQLDSTDLRMIVTELVDEGALKIRVSKSGNVLYQIAGFND